ncbi:MAG: antibiotic biosynthesis monooxygenase [Desulfobacteraceae bacterium]|jgi:heme-degrading monooxygenase HmoA
MAVKVLIKRRFKEGKDKEVFALVNKFRSEAMLQTGYITGESLISIDDPRKVLVISTWQHMENWLNWKEDPERKAIEAKLQPYLVDQSEYEVYVFGTYPAVKK